MSDLDQTHWDVVIVGTGMGGGTIGRALAEAGKKVLFVEKGHQGYRTEQTSFDVGVWDPKARALRGMWPDPVEATVDGVKRDVFAPLGSGLGGSSVFYAATLERPEPHDLDHSNSHPHPLGGWPVSYGDMQPHYDDAERMYAIHGEIDPLSDVTCPEVRNPPPPAPGDAAIMERLRDNGLHPYRLHAALKFVEGCAECFGRKCPKPCKMDARSAGVEPALATGNAHLLDRCDIERFETDGGQITAAIGTREGTPLRITGDRFILSAGALSSPRVLLASTSEDFPNGIGNHSDMVGRHLMFHLNEMFALWPGKDARFAGPSKAVGFRDLYYKDGKRLGMVQAMGIDASYGEIVYFLKGAVERSALRNIRLAKELVRIPAAIASKMLGNAKIFVGLLEDLPDPANRVLRDPERPDRVIFEYAVNADLLARRKAFRRGIKQAFKGTRTMFLSQSPEPNFGHPCGTCRMGADEATSVLAPDCRVHGTGNLWVVDASFMPTSMGVNPSLTIAANALRVAQTMIGQVDE